MYGEIINVGAECVFDEYGKGTVRLEFIGKNALKAEIMYIEKEEGYENLEDGIFIYRPYNIKDHESFVENRELEVQTKLGSWGDVRIISGIQEANHTVPLIYLTDKECNVLYCFGAPYQHDTSVKEIVVEDMNGDGLQDIKVITCFASAPDDFNFIWNFYQLENGWFYMGREEIFHRRRRAVFCAVFKPLRSVIISIPSLLLILSTQNSAVPDFTVSF